MTTITAYAGSDMLNRNLYNVYAGSYNSAVANNITYDGIYYPNVLEVQWRSGSFYYDSLFGGYNLQYYDYAGYKIITGGTATGYLELAWNGSSYSPSFKIEGMNISAVTLFNAFTTPSTADDLQVTQLQLSGADYIYGSDYSDVLIGYGGNDYLNGNGGVDTAVFVGARSQYSISGSPSSLTVIDNVSGRDGSDTVVNFEYLRFSDQTVATSAFTPTYILTAFSSSVNEGSTATFTLTTTNVASGTQVGYTLSGVSSSDVQGGSLSGSVTIGVNGQGTISVPILADKLTEGAETLTVTAAGKTASTVINDTSLTIVVPTYSLRAAGSSVNEGARIDFVLTTTNVAAGTQLTYTLSGVSAADIEGGSLTGSITVPANGISTFVVGLTADNLTEGVETLTASVAGVSASATVNDTSRGTSNSIVGTSGSDKFVASPGSNVVDGGAGVDSVQYASSRSAVSVTYKNGIITVSKADGTDTITNVERLDFTNGDLIYDITNPNAPAAYRLYGGAFDRTPDEGGFRYWADTLDAGVSMNVVAASFIASAEFQNRYGANLSNAAFVDALYQNVLHRPGEAAGVTYWNDVLDKKLANRADVLVSFTQLPEFVGISAANIDNGYWVV